MYWAPSNRYQAPGDEYWAPSDRYQASGDDYWAPSDKYQAPSDRQQAPSDNYWTTCVSVPYFKATSLAEWRMSWRELWSAFSCSMTKW